MKRLFSKKKSCKHLCSGKTNYWWFIQDPIFALTVFILVMYTLLSNGHQKPAEVITTQQEPSSIRTISLGMEARNV
jgi:hypothetical protein